MRKQLLHALAVGALAAGGLVTSSVIAPAHAWTGTDACNNEASDTNVYSNNTSVGVDNPLSGMAGVVYVCVRHPLIPGGEVTACAGPHEYQDSNGDYHVDTYVGVYTAPGGCRTIPLTVTP
jgi:hypothetical protein